MTKKILSDIIKTSSMSSNNQLADIFTKPLRGPQVIIYVTNWMHAPACGGVLITLYLL